MIKKRVRPTDNERFVHTTDTNVPCKSCSELWEVTYKNGRHTDADYFEHEENADAFMDKLAQKGDEHRLNGSK